MMHYDPKSFKSYNRHIGRKDNAPLRQDQTRDDIVALIKASGLSNAQIARTSGLCATTLKNWQTGKTRCPQHVTMKFALRALGKKFVVVDI